MNSETMTAQAVASGCRQGRSRALAAYHDVTRSVTSGAT
jgi:hypothetical protein